MEVSVPEKKLLSEECWIELSDDVKVRVDYPTRSQEVELRRLQKLWNFGLARADTEHWLSYYLRATIRDVVGFTIEGRLARLVLDRGLAKHLTNDDKTLDVVALFVDLDIVEELAGKINSRLEVTDVEKKTSQSPPSISEKENSKPDGNSSNPVQESLTVGIP
jgi:hypothetical protein